jgi:hypothetical protein
MLRCLCGEITLRGDWEGTLSIDKKDVRRGWCLCGDAGDVLSIVTFKLQEK